MLLGSFSVKLTKIEKTGVKFLPHTVDTGRKWTVHKTFRRRPGRLLNVLCTVNLRPVSAAQFLFL